MTWATENKFDISDPNDTKEQAEYAALYKAVMTALDGHDDVMQHRVLVMIVAQLIGYDTENNVEEIEENLGFFQHNLETQVSDMFDVKISE